MIKRVFNKHSITKYLINMSVFVVLLSTLTYSILFTIAEDKENDIRHTVQYLLNSKNVNLETICGIYRCDYIKFNHIIYQHLNNDMVKVNYIEDNDKDYMVIDTPKLTIYTNKEYFTNSVRNIVFVDSIIFFIIYTLFYIKITLYVSKNEDIKNKMNKLELESKLHTTVTEFAHHEMSLPVAVVKTLINEVFLTMFPCIHDTDNICRKNDELDACKKCSFYNDKKSLKAIDYYNRMMMSIERLEVVLNQMSETKNIKYSNGNISITKILQTAINGINKIAIGKLQLVIKNREILDNYAISSILSNGVFLNIVNNHFNNSKEANADIIVIEAKLVNNDEMIKLRLTDDGIGIHDQYGRLIKTENIFKPGYTTKDNDGNIVVKKKSLLEKIKSLFIKEEDNNKAPRGVGLYINREILRKVGGDIKLVETSKNGTTFELLIPVKPRRDDKKDN